MRAVVAGLLLLSGCDALFNLDHVPLAGDGGRGDADGSPDSVDIDADTVNFCMGTGRGFHPKFCYPLTSPFSGVLQLAGTVNTDVSCDEVQAQTNGPGICLRKAIIIRIEGNVRVIGGRPLVLLASDRIELSGTLDASSFRSGTKGAGANTAEAPGCNVGIIHGSAGTLGSGGSGGAGGSFKGGGGNGGNGDMTIGAIALPGVDPQLIRGGCNGGNGGNGNAGSGNTPGAAGGGSLYLAATDAIVVTGTVIVNGAGGEGGSTYYGGAGGGAGGMIVLDAPMVSVGSTAVLQAVGGGGGQGGSKTGGGGDGDDGPIAAGGTNSDTGGNGGDGSEGNAGGGGSGSGGGGGGGGGGGYIAIPSPNALIDMSASYRPQPMVQ